jgi:hypothetical protein
MRVLFAFAPIAILVTLIAFQVPICPTRNLLGIPCPGCGLTRATTAALHGDLEAMVHFHPLAPLLTPLFVYGLVRVSLVSAGFIRKEKKDLTTKVPAWLWTAIAAVVLGLWVARLFGYLGGSPDPVDFTTGILYRSAHAVHETLVH